ncbi:MAG: penicillin-binding protein 2 [Saprospiraceae bacterium]|nr:penicillin-binding protein 2 [Saprospiraceae bacterium]
MEDRSYIIRGIIIVTGLLMLLRVAYMQIFDESYRVKADAATIEKQVIQPSRGLIYDRNRKLMVFNQPIYDLYVTANLVNPEMDTAKLCRILSIDRQTFLKNIQKDFNDIRYSRNVPFLFMDKIDPVVYAQLQEVLHEFPGFISKVRSVRGYEFPYGSHALGYISEVDQQIIDSRSGYERRDYYGVSGMEATYEAYLRGEKGMEFQLKDNFGRKVGSYEQGQRDALATSGLDLITSIDIELQGYAEQLLRGKIGGIVAIEPATGEVLVLASSPSYHPQSLSVSANRQKTFSVLQSDTLKPFFNRALQAKYPPGSIFKPVLALIGLQEGVITVDRYITCTGGYVYKSFRWGCHAAPGVRNVVRAIQESCNTYFYTIYQDLVNIGGFEHPEIGLNRTADYLHQFGLGSTLQIDLPQEQGGFIPDSDYYDDLYEDKGDWRSTYIISNAIGQGEIELTTLQMANLAAVIGNRGFYYKPHIVRGFSDPSIPLENEYLTPKRVKIDDKHFDPVIEGMSRSVSMGTSRAAQIRDVEVCGKTGTSENPHGKDHSVFHAFAPRQNPKIAIAVFIENGGWGGSYAAPIASLIIEKYLKGEIDPSRLWLEERMMEVNLLAGE